MTGRDRREHPRAGRHRPGMFVVGGQVPTEDQLAAAQEDFPSSPLAGGPLEDSAAGNLPVCVDGEGHIPALNGRCVLCGLEDLDRAEPVSEAVAEAIRWDQAAAAEPWQVDVTRTLEDTTRMGNGLSAAVRQELLRRPASHLDAAVRLELAADAMRESYLDRLGPGFSADYPTDPVDGAELDPVDGLPVVDEDQAEEDDATRFMSLADLEAAAQPLTLAAAPAVFVPMTVPQAQAFGGAPARILNWTSRHDPKSLEFGVRQKLRAPAPLMDREWDHGPILDQGTAPPLSLHDASGCTGHAAVNAANVLTLAAAPAGEDLPAPLAGAEAMRLYQRAQELDELPGETYPGTSILAVMKAGQEAGLWASYLWAFGTRDIAQALLQVGPVVIGIPWRSGMTEPGPDGIVAVDGEDLGGHALCLFAIRMAVAGRAGPWFGALQTWGEGVGDHGVIWFHHKDLAGLLHGVGEAAIPVSVGGLA